MFVLASVVAVVVVIDYPFTKLNYIYSNSFRGPCQCGLWPGGGTPSSSLRAMFVGNFSGYL